MKIDREFVGHITDTIDGLRNLLENIEDKQDDISFQSVSYFLYRASLELGLLRRSIS